MSRDRYNSWWYTENLSPPPLELCFVFVVLISLLGFSWYVSYESALEDLMDQLKLFLLALPVVLLLALHCLSSERFPLGILMPAEQDSIHRAGASPWGVGILLLFLMFMISFRSSLQERWFPLFSRG